MTLEKLKSYVINCLKQGFSEQAIRVVTSNAGWDKEDVDEVFRDEDVKDVMSEMETEREEAVKADDDHAGEEGSSSQGDPNNKEDEESEDGEGIENGGEKSDEEEKDKADTDDEEVDVAPAPKPQPNDELKKYILEHLEEGFTPKVVGVSAMDKGWSEEEIDQVFEDDEVQKTIEEVEAREDAFEEQKDVTKGEETDTGESPEPDTSEAPFASEGVDDDAVQEETFENAEEEVKESDKKEEKEEVPAVEKEEKEDRPGPEKEKTRPSSHDLSVKQDEEGELVPNVEKDDDEGIKEEKTKEIKTERSPIEEKDINKEIKEKDDNSLSSEEKVEVSSEDRKKVEEEKESQKEKGATVSSEIDPSLKFFIESKLMEGSGISEVCMAALEKGWDKGEIDAAFEDDDIKAVLFNEEQKDTSKDEEKDEVSEAKKNVVENTEEEVKESDKKKEKEEEPVVEKEEKEDRSGPEKEKTRPSSHDPSAIKEQGQIEEKENTEVVSEIPTNKKKAREIRTDKETEDPENSKEVHEVDEDQELDDIEREDEDSVIPDERSVSEVEFGKETKEESVEKKDRNLDVDTAEEEEKNEPDKEGSTAVDNEKTEDSDTQTVPRKSATEEEADGGDELPEKGRSAEDDKEELNIPAPPESEHFSEGDGEERKEDVDDETEDDPFGFGEIKLVPKQESAPSEPSGDTGQMQENPFGEGYSEFDNRKDVQNGNKVISQGFFGNAPGQVPAGNYRPNGQHFQAGGGYSSSMPAGGGSFAQVGHINPALKFYVINHLKEGFASQTIRNVALKAGWMEREIDDVFSDPEVRAIASVFESQNVTFSGAPAVSRAGSGFASNTRQGFMGDNIGGRSSTPYQSAPSYTPVQKHPKASASDHSATPNWNSVASYPSGQTKQPTSFESSKETEFKEEGLNKKQGVERINPLLRKYISDNLKKGFSAVSIKEVAIDAGWPEAEVEAVFEEDEIKELMKAQAEGVYYKESQGDKGKDPKQEGESKAGTEKDPVSKEKPGVKTRPSSHASGFVVSASKEDPDKVEEKKKEAPSEDGKDQKEEAASKEKNEPSPEAEAAPIASSDTASENGGKAETSTKKDKGKDNGSASDISGGSREQKIQNETPTGGSLSSFEEQLKKARQKSESQDKDDKRDNNKKEPSKAKTEVPDTQEKEPRKSGQYVDVPDYSVVDEAPDPEQENDKKEKLNKVKEADNKDADDKGPSDDNEPVKNESDASPWKDDKEATSGSREEFERPKVKRDISNPASFFIENPDDIIDVEDSEDEKADQGS